MRCIFDLETLRETRAVFTPWIHGAATEFDFKIEWEGPPLRRVAFGLNYSQIFLLSTQRTPNSLFCIGQKMKICVRVCSWEGTGDLTVIFAAVGQVKTSFLAVLGVVLDECSYGRCQQRFARLRCADENLSA